MRYFTTDWFAEMQVFGLLSLLPESEEEWEESTRYSNEKGMDFKKCFREQLESIRSELPGFLPEAFHDCLPDDILDEEFPTAELLEAASEWKKDYQQWLEEHGRAYASRYRIIKDSLPEQVISLHENSLHDAKVKSIEFLTEDALIMTLDCRNGFHYFQDVKLTFTGVAECLLPANLDEARWLYDEVDLSVRGYELSILFQRPTAEGSVCEFKVLAEAVRIEVLED